MTIELIALNSRLSLLSVFRIKYLPIWEEGLEMSQRNVVFVLTTLHALTSRLLYDTNYCKSHNYWINDRTPCTTRIRDECQSNTSPT